jgi:Centrosome localisation domain of Cep57
MQDRGEADSDADGWKQQQQQQGDAVQDNTARSFTFSSAEQEHLNSPAQSHRFSPPASPTRVTLHRSGSVVIESANASVASPEQYSTRDLPLPPQSQRASQADADLREISAAMRYVNVSSNGGRANISSSAVLAAARHSSSDAQQHLQQQRPAYTSFTSDTAAPSSSANYGYSYNASTAYSRTQHTAAAQQQQQQSSPARSTGSYSARYGDPLVYGGSSGTGGGASSSQAVLSALKSLQEKIRRLEVDRDAAISEGSELRAKLERQQADNEHQQVSNASIIYINVYKIMQWSFTQNKLKVSTG